MAQKFAMSSAGGSESSSSKELCLLSLDGGGVRGLSMLLILKRLMEGIDPINPPKPCDYFDMIGGTSTGGLIAIMLGRMKMTIEQCEKAYEKLSPLVFTKLRHSIKLFAEPQGRFDHKAMEKEIQKILVEHDMDSEELMKVSGSDDCKTFVCTTSANTGKIVVLSSYHNERRIADTWNKAKIWEVARATSAATTFFEPISFCNDTYVDGATGANNPVSVLWSEATDVWRLQDNQVQENIKCLVSIGTGVPDLTPFKGNLLQIGKALKAIATQTEDTAEDFRKKHTTLFQTKRAFRFNVLKGLEKIGLEEVSKWGDIAAATNHYIQTEEVYVDMKRCAANLRERELLKQLVADILATVKQPIFDLNDRAHPSRKDLQWFAHTSSYDKWEEHGYGLLWYQRDPQSHIRSRGYLAATIGYHIAKRSPCCARNELDCRSDELCRAIYFQCEKPQSIGADHTICNVGDVWLSLIYQVLLVGCKDWSVLFTRLSKILHQNEDLLTKIFRIKEASISELHQLFVQALHTSEAPDVICIDNAHLIEETARGVFLQSLVKLVEAELPLLNFKIPLLITGYPSHIGNHLGEKLTISDRTEREECIKTLHFAEWKLRRDQVADAGIGTNDWIWTHPEYQDWESVETGFLWIEGKPGSGKSVLAKTLQRRLSQPRVTGFSSSFHRPFYRNNTVLGTSPAVVRSEVSLMVADWFFHSRGGDRGIDHLPFFKSILYQLLQQDKKVFDLIAEDYRKFYPGKSNSLYPQASTTYYPDSFNPYPSAFAEFTPNLYTDDQFIDSTLNPLASSNLDSFAHLSLNPVDHLVPWSSTLYPSNPCDNFNFETGNAPAISNFESDQSSFQPQIRFSNPYRPRYTQHWNLHTCRKALEKISEAGFPILCIVDAIDEARPADGERQRNDSGRSLSVLSMLRDLRRNTRPVKIKFIVLSRPNPTIEMDFQSIRKSLRQNTFKIILEHENEKAIVLTIDKGLQSLRQTLHAYDSEEETFRKPKARKYKGLDTFQSKPLAISEAQSIENIRTYLYSNAKGVILWVSLVLGELEKHAAGVISTFMDLEKIAQRVPMALDNIYDYIIKDLQENLNEADITKARTTFLLISGSAALGRPIRLQELRDALALPSDIEQALTAKNDPIIGNRTPIKSWDSFRRLLRRLCGPLIEVVSSENSVQQVAGNHDTDVGPDDIIQFMHQTVKDYLYSLESTHRFKPNDPFYFRFNPRDAIKKTIETAQGYIAVSFPQTRTQYGPEEHPEDEFSWKRNVEDLVDYLESRTLMSFSLSVLRSRPTLLPTTLGPYGSIYEQSGLHEYLELHSTKDEQKQFIGQDFSLYPENLAYPKSGTLGAVEAPILGHAFRHACKERYLTAVEILMEICERYDSHAADWKWPVIRTAALLVSIETGLFGEVARLTSDSKQFHRSGGYLRWSVEHRDCVDLNVSRRKIDEPATVGSVEVVRHPFTQLAIDSGQPEIVHHLSTIDYLFRDTSVHYQFDALGKVTSAHHTQAPGHKSNSHHFSLAPAKNWQNKLRPGAWAGYESMKRLPSLRQKWIWEAEDNRLSKGIADEESIDDAREVVQWLINYLQTCDT